MTMQKKLEKEIHSTPSSEEEEYISSVAESLPSSLSMSDRDAAPVDASDSDSEATVEEREATSSSEDEESDSNDQAKRKSFEDLGLNKWLIETLQNVSITRPSEIQEACIPAILQGLISILRLIHSFMCNNRPGLHWKC